MQSPTDLNQLPAAVSVNAIAALKKAMPKLERYPRLAATSYKLSPSVAKLLGVTIHSHEILYKANTVFPFNFFPDTIVIDKEKLTIIERFFFWVAKITSVPIR